MKIYQVINDNLTAITGYMIGQRVTGDNVLDAIVAYANDNNGMNGDNFEFDRYLWKKLYLNEDMPLSINTVWNYVSKFLEEVPDLKF